MWLHKLAARFAQVEDGPDADGQVDGAKARANPERPESAKSVDLAALAVVSVSVDLLVLAAESADDGPSVSVPNGMVAQSPQLFQHRLKIEAVFTF